MAYRSLSDRVAAELKRAHPDPKPEPQFAGTPTYTPPPDKEPSNQFSGSATYTPPPEKKKLIDYGYDPEHVRTLVERAPSKPKPVRHSSSVLRDLRKMKRPGR